MKRNIVRFLVKWIVTASICFLIAVGASCVRKMAGETPEQTKTRKRAIYSAQVITGLSGLSDLTEILADAQTVSRSSAYKLVEIDERALSSVDILREQLRTGFDAGAIGKVRNVIADIDQARQSGAITFNSEKALNFYFDAVATVEVSLNLIEAIQAGQKEPSVRVAGSRALQSLQSGSSEPKWWNRAIVKATEIYRIMAEQGAMDTAGAWADGDQRSKQLHERNKARLDAWRVI